MVLGLGWMIAYWWVLLIEAIVGLFLIGGLSIVASKLVGKEPKSLGRLRASIYGTLILILISYFALGVGILHYIGLGTGAEGILLGAVILVALISILQWLFSPYIINLAYRTRPPYDEREREIAHLANHLADEAGMRRKPKLVIVDTNMPNAFTYGSPLAGSYIAITRGLLRIASKDEIAAVIGHELGHLKHRDVGWILALSIVPLAVYFIGRSLIYASMFSGGSSRRENNAGTLLLIGIALIALGFLFRLMIAHFNRLREYYADAFSTVHLHKGRELQRALTKIYLRVKQETPTIQSGLNLASALFIVAPLIEVNGGFFVDPSTDSIVEAVKREKVNPMLEVLSTHPPVPKRLRFIDNLIYKTASWGA